MRKRLMQQIAATMLLAGVCVAGALRARKTGRVTPD